MSTSIRSRVTGEPRPSTARVARASPPTLLKYWHTVRHLKPVQFYRRFWFRLYVPKADERPAPSLRKREGPWRRPAERAPVMERPNALRLLNREGSVGKPADWNDPGQDKLWLYNLHYFDDLNRQGAGERAAWHRALIGRWIADNPPGEGIGWEPYPLSLRIVNWIKWAEAGHTLEPHWLDSLAVQARFLSRRLEWHLLGNHLIANAKALIFAGAFFDGEEADSWRKKGLDILARQFPEQVLPDGGHFELSPMYHGTVLEDVLDLVNLAGARVGVFSGSTVEYWRRTARRMGGWLGAMVHPDAEIAFFNDAAFGIAPRLDHLEAYFTRLGLSRSTSPREGVTHLTQSGYVRIAQGDVVALLDVGPVGPDYLPGHGHADTLSFELSLFAQRIIVNSGTSEYEAGPERLRQRGTAAHSTVEVDGESSSEVWGSFRVARRARPLDLHIEDAQEFISVRCAHDGYRRLPGRVLHRRVWSFGRRSVCVCDELTGQWRRATARFHLHPDVDVEGHGNEGALSLKGGQGMTWRLEGGKARIAPSTWHPEFGLSVPTNCLELDISGPNCRLTLEW